MLDLNVYGRKYAHMKTVKTTIEIDEHKLETVMKVGGFKTRKEAVDWALTEAARIASASRIAETPWDSAALEGAIDPAYDVLESRRTR